MNYVDLISAIKLMGQGMIAIFIVMGIISVIISLSTKIKIKENIK